MTSGNRWDHLDWQGQPVGHRYRGDTLCWACDQALLRSRATHVATLAYHPECIVATVELYSNEGEWGIYATTVDRETGEVLAYSLYA